MQLDTTKSGPAGIGLMVGQTVTGIKVGEDTATITTDKGEWRFFHHQDCCESVTITDVSIPPEEMVGRVVSFASEEIKGSKLGWGSCTETTHTIVAEGRTLTVWWRGESNGYYSESVDVRFTPYATVTETETTAAEKLEDFLNIPVIHTLAHHRALLERLRQKVAGDLALNKAILSAGGEVAS